MDPVNAIIWNCASILNYVYFIANGRKFFSILLSLEKKLN